MKIRIIIGLVILVLFASCSINKQKLTDSDAYKPFKKFRGDIDRYLNYNFEEHSQKYIGKNASLLFHDLELQPTKLGYSGKDDTIGTFRLKYYLKSNNMLGDTLDAVFNTLIIGLKPPPNGVEVKKLLDKNEKKWTLKLQGLFEKQIVTYVYTSGRSFSLSTNPPVYKSLTELNGDTLGYISYNFAENKSNYIRRTLSSIINDLEVKPYSYEYAKAPFSKKKCYQISLIFNQKTLKKAGKAIKTTLMIDFSNPILISDIKKLEKRSGKKWIKEHTVFFGNQVIRDINFRTSSH